MSAGVGPVPTPVPAEWLGAGRTLWEPALSPDGRCVAVGSSTGGLHELLVIDLGDGAEVGLGPERPLLASPPIVPPHPAGGGSWCWLPDSSGVVHAAADGALWMARRAGGPSVCVMRPPAEGQTLWSPAVSPDATLLAAVAADAETETVLVGPLPVPGGAVPGGAVPGGVVPGQPRPVSSAGYVLDPAWTADGSLLWHEWDEPHMPWTSSRIAARRPDGTIEILAAGTVSQPRAPHPGPHPGPGPVGWIDETTRWRELHTADGPVVSPTDGHEHADPTWGPGQRSWCWSPDGAQVAFDRNEQGYGRLCTAVPGGPAEAVRELAKGVHSGLSWAVTPQGHQRLAALRSGHRTPTQLVVYDPVSGTRTVLAHSTPQAWEGLELPEPEAVTWTSEGVEIPGRWYRPPEGVTPRGLVVSVHGGPTGQTRVTWMPRVAWFVTRGWSVLVADYRGSTGWGRAHREALDGRWADADVLDVLAAARAAEERGWAEPGRVVVMGGSAGGFTTLHALAAGGDAVAAGIALYPVTDLGELDATTHRFERHYTRILVGPVERSDECSPMTVAEAITAPLLLLHGDADRVVPVGQSQALAERLAALGRPAELHVYAGEGHGWRRPETTVDELTRIGAFLDRHLPPAAS